MARDSTPVVVAGSGGAGAITADSTLLRAAAYHLLQLALRNEQRAKAFFQKHCGHDS